MTDTRCDLLFSLLSTAYKEFNFAPSLFAQEKFSEFEHAYQLLSLLEGFDDLEGLDTFLRTLDFNSDEGIESIIVLLTQLSMVYKDEFQQKMFHERIISLLDGKTDEEIVLMTAGKFSIESIHTYRKMYRVGNKYIFSIHTLTTILYLIS